jgi:antitoxin component of MazEF toxin-antitoxin module
MALIKRLSRHGNSLALVIDRGLLEVLDFDEKTDLQLSTDGVRLLIARAEDPARARRVRRAADASLRRFGKMYARLADR